MFASKNGRIMKYISKRYCKKAVFFWSNAIDTNS